MKKIFYFLFLFLFVVPFSFSSDFYEYYNYRTGYLTCNGWTTPTQSIQGGDNCTYNDYIYSNFSRNTSIYGYDTSAPYNTFNLSVNMTFVNAFYNRVQVNLYEDYAKEKPLSFKIWDNEQKDTLIGSWVSNAVGDLTGAVTNWTTANVSIIPNNYSSMYFEFVANGEAGPYYAFVKQINIQYGGYFDNHLPLYNITWESILYINQTNPTATLNYDLETYDEEGDTIYYATEVGYNYNKTLVIDFEKYDCTLWFCDYVADITDLQYINAMPGACEITPVLAFEHEVTINYYEIDGKNTPYLVLDSQCADPVRIYTDVLNSDVNYFNIWDSATTIDSYNFFGMDLAGEILFNFSIVDYNATSSTVYNNGTQEAQNITVENDKYIQFETMNLDENVYTVKYWDGVYSYTWNYNTTGDTSNKKLAFIGVELNTGYIGINKIVKAQVIQNFTWTTTKPSSVTFNNEGMYTYHVYITDSYHLPINQYDTITMDINVIDTSSYYYNPEGEEFYEDIDNLVGDAWKDYFSELELNEKAIKFFPFLWVVLVIIFSVMLYKNSNELKLSLAAFLASISCLGYAIISGLILPLLSFLVLSAISLVILIMGTRK